MTTQLSNRSIKVSDQNLRISLELMEMNNKVESDSLCCNQYKSCKSDEEGRNKLCDLSNVSNQMTPNHQTYNKNPEYCLIIPSKEVLI